MGDDLHDPLGLGRKPARRLPLRPLALSVAAVAIVGGSAWIEWRGDPFGGEPHAVAVIGPATPPQAAAPPPAAPSPNLPQVAVGDITGSIARPASANSAPDGSAAAIEEKSGVKVFRNGDGKPPGALIIEVPQLLAQRLVPAPDPRLVEKSRYGVLPRIGKDGARPAGVYARPFIANPARAASPRIALVVSGVGLSDAATQQAITDLPGVVTLAFAPYGQDLPAKVAQAREAGHEAVLQLPMEPIDYPHTNPGAHTLLASASPAQNADSLHWLLARFTGYTGVANFLGAKFLSAQDALRPVLQEIGARGLFYVDDGAGGRSLALGLAKAARLPAAHVDLILDAPADGVAPTVTIEANLAKLETLARDNGLAIGMAADLPANVAKIARYARDAEAHGIVLVPLSAAVGRSVTETTSAPGSFSGGAYSDR